MQTTPTPAPTTSPSPELKRTLGGGQVLFYGLGSMLGAGIYTLVGDAAKILGNGLWLAFLGALVGALLTGLTYASAGSRHPRAGGAAYIIGRAFRLPLLSSAAGIAVMMSGLTSMAMGLQAIARNILAADAPSIAIKLTAIGVAALIGLVIYRGIRESMWLNILCTIVEAGGLLFIIAIGCRYWGEVDYLAGPGDTAGIPGSGISLALIMQGAILAFFSFMGFEDILNVSEEVKNPQRDVPFGIVGAMVSAALIYIAVAITAVSVLGWERMASSSVNPLREVARVAAPWFHNIDLVYTGISIFAIGNTALLNYIMGSRLLYGMSRQELLPAALGRVSAARQTPHVAIFTLFGIVSMLILAGDVKAMAEATVLLLLIVFAFMNVSLLILQRRPGEERGSFEIPSLIPALGALVCLTLCGSRLLHAVRDPSQRTAPLVALGIVIVGLIIGKLRGAKVSST